MSYDIALDHQWGGNGWRERSSGTSVVDITDGILTTTSDSDSDPAFLDYYVPILPGQRIDISVEGRLVSGDVGVFLDELIHAGTGTLFDYVYLSGVDWKRYRLGYTAPMKATTGSYLRVGFGVRTAETGSGQFFNPIIRVSDGFGAPVVMARGLLRLINGTPDLHTNFPSHGVASVSFNGTTTVTVNLSHQIMASPQNVRPHLRLTGSGDATNLYVPVAGNLTTGATPAFDIKWSNGSTTQTVSTGSYFVWFEVSF